MRRYCDPAYAFPPQKDVIRFAVDLVREAAFNQPNLLVVTGTYTIGKERIFLGEKQVLSSNAIVIIEEIGLAHIFQYSVCSNS